MKDAAQTKTLFQKREVKIEEILVLKKSRELKDRYE
jgi:hypothetical protein